MKRYLPTQLIEFLTAVDDALVQLVGRDEAAEPVRVVVIGGSAAALSYGATRATYDIDTWNLVPPLLEQAADIARKRTGLAVPLVKSPIADGPYQLEDRLQQALPQLRLLKVLVPERHDLVLMKVLRCAEHDLAVIEEIHAHSPLDLETLIQRFKVELLPQAIGKT